MNHAGLCQFIGGAADFEPMIVVANRVKQSDWRQQIYGRYDIPSNVIITKDFAGDFDGFLSR